MSGDDRVRQCGQCDRKVHNLSNMTREEATELISGAKGRMCVRYFVRPDGMGMTRDCGQPTEATKKISLAAIGLSIAASLSLAGCIQVSQGDMMAPPRPLSEITSELKQVNADLAKEKDHDMRVQLSGHRDRLISELKEAKSEIKP